MSVTNLPADRSWAARLSYAFALALAPISTPWTRWLRLMERREWQLRQQDRRAAEMFLTFARQARDSSSRYKDASSPA